MPGLRHGMSLIETNEMSLGFGAGVVLSGVNFAIEPGEIVTVVGPNGSGKSTLLRALLGVLKPSVDRVRQKPGLRIGYVPQKLAIDETMPITVARFLSLPIRRGAAEIDEVL